MAIALPHSSPLLKHLSWACPNASVPHATSKLRSGQRPGCSPRISSKRLSECGSLLSQGVTNSSLPTATPRQNVWRSYPHIFPTLKVHPAPSCPSPLCCNASLGGQRLLLLNCVPRQSSSSKGWAPQMSIAPKGAYSYIFSCREARRRNFLGERGRRENTDRF